MAQCEEIASHHQHVVALSMSSHAERNNKNPQRAPTPQLAHHTHAATQTRPQRSGSNGRVGRRPPPPPTLKRHHTTISQLALWLPPMGNQPPPPSPEPAPNCPHKPEGKAITPRTGGPEFGEDTPPGVPMLRPPPTLAAAKAPAAVSLKPRPAAPTFPEVVPTSRWSPHL